jgi:hypothetical protein
VSKSVLIGVWQLWKQERVGSVLGQCEEQRLILENLVHSLRIRLSDCYDTDHAVNGA